MATYNLISTAGTGACGPAPIPIVDLGRLYRLGKIEFGTQRGAWFSRWIYTSTNCSTYSLLYTANQGGTITWTGETIARCLNLVVDYGPNISCAIINIYELVYATNLSISSTPSGARIFLNNVDQGVNTPYTISNLSPGTYNIKLTKVGYNDWTGQATVTDNQTTNVSATLTPLTGSLSISSTPSGARIFINNVDQSIITPNTIANLNPATYDVKLTLANYYDWTGTATIISGQTTTITPTLTPLPGNLSITSTPSGARIYIDNIDQGVNTSNTISALTPGSHNIRLTLTNYNDYTTPVTILSNQTTTLSPNLTLSPGITRIEVSPSFTQPSYVGEIIDLGIIKIDYQGTGTIILEKTIVYDRLVLTGPNGIFDYTWTPCGTIGPQGPFDITNIFTPGYNEINVKIYNVCGGNIGTVTGSIDITGPITLACPITPKYSGDTVTLNATPKDGIGPYYVEFRKNGVAIPGNDPLGRPYTIPSSPENTTISRQYILNDVDIAAAMTGTINFEVYMEDSCPSLIGPKTCDQICTINIGCVAPVCNFAVT